MGRRGRAGVGGAVRAARRPRAAWYLVSVLGLLVALPLGVVGVVGLAWQDWRHPDSSTDRATLVRGGRYDLEGVHGDYGDVWTRVAPGDRVSCVFTPTGGGAGAFTRTFVVPDQHRPGHLSGSPAAEDRDTARVGSFTASGAGAYRLACADRTGGAGGDLAVRVRQAPSGWPTIVLYVAIGLAVAAIVWITVLLRLRTRSRLVRAVIDVGADIATS